MQNDPIKFYVITTFLIVYFIPLKKIFVYIIKLFKMPFLSKQF